MHHCLLFIHHLSLKFVTFPPRNVTLHTLMMLVRHAGALFFTVISMTIATHFQWKLTMTSLRSQQQVDHKAMVKINHHHGLKYCMETKLLWNIYSLKCCSCYNTFWCIAWFVVLMWWATSIKSCTPVSHLMCSLSPLNCDTDSKAKASPMTMCKHWTALHLSRPFVNIV